MNPERRRMFQRLGPNAEDVRWLDDLAVAETAMQATEAP